jgi:DNA-binding CsgD family transcriptional regulator
LNKTKSNWAEEWIESEPLARVLVGADLRLLWRNPAADTLLKSDIGIFERDGYLQAADRDVQARLEELAVDALPQRAWSIIGKPGTAIHFAVQAWRPADGDAPRGLAFRALQDIKLSKLLDLPVGFGLTRAEQQVVRMMLAGQSTSQIAAELKNSVLTVRTHIKRVYSKLGINSREQLFARLAVYMFLSLQ